MSIRTASAQWEGTLKEGKGTMSLGSGAFEGAYSFSSRFEEGTGTNPEELVGAAYAGCFSMAFANGLSGAGFPPTSIRSAAKVHFTRDDSGPKISTIELETEGDVPGVDEATFQQIAEKTKSTCPISRALTGVELKVNARLAGQADPSDG